MKHLDSINPAFARPKTLCSIGAIIPFILSVSAVALASGADEGVSILDNPLAVLFLCFSGISFALFFIPHIFKWNWSAKYFFVSSLEMGSLALLGTSPWLCFLFYASLWWPMRLLCFAIYLLTIISFSRQFFLMYTDVKKSKTRLGYIYNSDPDGITYYQQKNDTHLIEKIYKLSFYPSLNCFLFFIAASFATIPFAKTIADFIGLPFPHIFLGIFAIPIDMMALAFLNRGWFVFVRLPNFIAQSNKLFYVDMASKSKFDDI